LSTLIYTPAITMVIDTEKHGMIDVSEDLISGGVSLRENGSHSFNVTVSNAYRKYDGMFTPNDRVVIQMKRLSWLQVFAGYMNSVPFFSTYPREVSLTGQCGLKILQNWPWDAHTDKANEFLAAATSTDRSAQDGGIGAVTVKLLNEVVGWPKSKIHIARVPDQWFAKFEEIYKAVAGEVSTTRSLLGANPYISGEVMFPGGNTGNESITATATDIDVILRNIRKMESNYNYLAVNKGDGKGGWATGAYQIMDRTWDNYKGYSRAYEASPLIQDEKARAMVQDILNKRGNAVINVPYSWYYPRVFSNPKLLDQIPAGNEGNNLTIRQYGQKWMDSYTVLYKEQFGRAPTSSVNAKVGVALAPSPSATPSGTSAPNTSVDMSKALYPIPAGVSKLESTKVAWGGYANGKVPLTAMKYAAGIGYGHPAAVNSLVLLIEAAKSAGYDLRGSCYRSLESQIEGAKKSKAFATPGRSNHGWGLAIDFTALTKGNQAAFASPEYAWLKSNAWRYGWGHPSWAQDGGSKPEPWHWEFFAFENFRNSPEAAPGTGLNPFNIDVAQNMPQTEAAQLFSAIAFWTFGDNETDEANMLVGQRATMNDTPILETIQGFLRAANRSYCCAPNGDFIAWFPDYWGEYGTAGRVNVELIELQDFTVEWDDQSLITHEFVEGALAPSGIGPLPAGVRDAVTALLTAGVVTVELPNLLQALVNVNTTEYPWLKDPQALLNRFGARIDRQFVSTIFGPQQEFWYAVNEFTKAWAGMFKANIPLMFMPELFPGMLLCIPELKVQFYVTGVSHRFSMADGQGFTTDVSVIAPSAMDGSGFYLFPKGGSVPARGSGGGGGRGMYRS